MLHVWNIYLQNWAIVWGKCRYSMHGASGLLGHRNVTWLNQHQHVELKTRQWELSSAKKRDQMILIVKAKQHVLHI